MKALVVIGTRRRRLSSLAIVRTLREDSKHFEVKVLCHRPAREMLDQVLRFFGIVPNST